MRALPTIDHDAMAAGFHQKAWMIALRRWDAGRGSEKGQVEHDRGDALIGERGSNVQTNYSLNEQPTIFPPRPIDPEQHVLALDLLVVAILNDYLDLKLPTK